MAKAACAGAVIERYEQPWRQGGAAWRNKKKNQSRGKHGGRPEAQPNKQGHRGSEHCQSTAYLVWRCQALQGFLQEGFSPESTASDSSAEDNQFLQEPENCQEDVSILLHTATDPGFGEFRARSEFQELPKIIIQTTPGLGREGPGYNPALIHPTRAWSKSSFSLKHSPCSPDTPVLPPTTAFQYQPSIFLNKSMQQGTTTKKFCAIFFETKNKLLLNCKQTLYRNLSVMCLFSCGNLSCTCVLAPDKRLGELSSRGCAVSACSQLCSLETSS